MNANNVTISPAALALFLALANDAGNWSGTPLFGPKGNVGYEPADKGHLLWLKRAGFVTTQEDDDGYAFCRFTVIGRALAAEHGINLSIYY
jgi:hypothetical protein